MTLVAAAVLPAAPLLVPDVAGALPEGVSEVTEAVGDVRAGLAQAETVVIAARGGGRGVHRSAVACLDGIGRPDVAAEAPVDAPLRDALAAALGWPLVEGSLPLDLAVLALLLGAPRVVALSLPADAGFAELARAGGSVAEVIAGTARPAGVVAAGDLSAGLGERSPLYAVEGAGAFDEEVLDAVDAGRLTDLEGLGPARARRVGARGWVALALLAGVSRRSGLRPTRRLYAAPRGVGYLVAATGS